MLISRPTKFGAGITLGGDCLDFKGLHETVHYLAAESGPISRNHFEFTLGLADDFRKACEGAREEWLPEVPAYAGYSAVDVLWSVFLTQLGMLRSACAYTPTSRRVQAHLYALESCAEQALSELDPAVGALCMRWLANFGPLPDGFLVEFVTHQSYEFVFGANPGKARFRRLPRLLDEISSFSTAYQEFDRDITKRAHAQGARREDFGDWSEWPAFKW